VTPAQRHSGQDRDILRARHDLYIKAKESKPSRWSGNTQDWTPVGAVTLNPEREAIVSAAVLKAENKTKEAA
jgi:putative transposase